MVVPRFEPAEVHSLTPDENPLPPCLEHLSDQAFGEFTAGAALSGNTAVTTESYFPFSNINLVYRLRLTLMARHLGWGDLDLGSSFGWWATTGVVRETPHRK